MWEPFFGVVAGGLCKIQSLPPSAPSNSINNNDNIAMCVFSKEVTSVTDTKIFVGKLMTNTAIKQFTVYGNQVQLGDQPSAMILPLPNPGCLPDQIEVVDMTGYADLFQDLHDVFPKRKGVGFHSKGIGNSVGAEPKLEILQCGGYEYSIANSLEDLDRLDWQHFEADEHVKTLLQKHYASDFGFLVCKCSNSGIYAPIGIIHPSVEGRLYVPTMHDHGTNKGDAAEWSHTIYGLNAAESAKPYLRTSLDQIVAFEQLDMTAIGSKSLKYHLLPEGLMVSTSTEKRPFSNPTSVGTMLKIIISGKQGNGDLYLVDRVLPNAPLPCCSYELTEGAFVMQPSYLCHTCAPQARSLNLDLCQFCADQHTAAGHHVESFRQLNAACDRYGTKSI